MASFDRPLSRLNLELLPKRHTLWQDRRCHPVLSSSPTLRQRREVLTCTMGTLKTCTTITPIPLPADDCDSAHSMHAALSSLRATTASFDAAMDAVLATTSRHHQRVEALQRRIEKFRELLLKLDEVAASKMKEGGIDDRVCMVYCPGSYESALKGLEVELAKVREDISTSNAVRSAANDAVQNAIKQDIQRDDAQAVPSDSWLDSSSTGLGVGKALQATDEQRSVPLLLKDDVRSVDPNYEGMLDELIYKREDSQQGESLEGDASGVGKGDDETVYTVTSQMSSVSVASSSRVTAGQRRRNRKQQTHSAKLMAKTSPGGMHTLPEVSSQNNFTVAAGRQQALVGSQPFLCEVMHDSYGIGMEPPAGLVDCSGFSARGTRESGAAFYPPISHVNAMQVFNTTRNSFGTTEGLQSGAIAQPHFDPPKERDVSKGVTKTQQPSANNST